LALIFSASLVLKAGVKQGASGPVTLLPHLATRQPAQAPFFRGEIAVDGYDPGKGFPQ
jgi:hypothetical protein